MIVNAVRRAIEQQVWIDRIAEPLQGAIRSVLEWAPPVAKVLHGEFLGHPLHAALVTIPIGAWACTLALDVGGLFTGGVLGRCADATCAIGIAGALAAAVAGAADWSHTTGTGRRVGFIHAATNLVVVGLYGVSLASRLVGLRGVGIGISTVAFGLVGFSGWLGGELSYVYGVGVSPRACARPEDAGYRGPEGHEEAGQSGGEDAYRG